MFMETTKLKNKSTVLVFSKDNPANLHYKDLIMLFYNSQPPKGLTWRQMKDHFDFLEELDRVGVDEDIEIKKSVLEDLKSKIETFKWPIINKDIIAFSEEILNLV